MLAGWSQPRHRTNAPTASKTPDMNQPEPDVL
jgi:hypothetical protein